MSDHTLTRLEGEVEAARTKLAADLATLTSPSTIRQFRQVLSAEATSVKDQIVRSVQDNARSRVQDIIGGLKAKAAANPVAVAAIGVGIAWRLMRHPPVTTALVGVGLYSLLNTDRHDPPFLERHGLEDTAAALRNKASDWSEAAADMAERTTDTLQDWSVRARSTAAELTADAVEQTGSAVDRLADAPAALRHTAQRASAQAVESGEQIVANVRATLADDESRDRMLLGVAGVAVAAALGLAFQRRE